MQLEPLAAPSGPVVGGMVACRPLVSDADDQLTTSVGLVEHLVGDRGVGAVPVEGAGLGRCRQREEDSR